jgi:uncharacterized phosphosugar-binding protein
MEKKKKDFIELLLRNKYNILLTIEESGIDLYEFNDWLLDNDEQFRDTILMIENQCALIIKMLIMNKALEGDAKTQFDAMKLVIDKFSKIATKQTEAEIFRAKLPSINEEGFLISHEIEV